MQKYHICFANTWAIENQANVDKDVMFDEVAKEWEHPFGQCEVSNGDINWILDYMQPSDETIQSLKQIKPFTKKASFEVFRLEDEWKDIDSFEGTFIDALKYIQREFK